MQQRGSHEQALAAFRDGRGADPAGHADDRQGARFSQRDAGGRVNADTALHLPDFRAAERTFQLVTQVAGRTGRGPKGGRVLVQTLRPDAPAILAAVRHDLAAFARAGAAAPRGARLSAVRVDGADRRPRRKQSAQHKALAEEIGRRLATGGSGNRGDTRSRPGTGADDATSRATIGFKFSCSRPTASCFDGAVRAATADLKAPEGTGWIVDVDPLDMM